MALSMTLAFLKCLFTSFLERFMVAWFIFCEVLQSIFKVGTLYFAARFFWCKGLSSGHCTCFLIMISVALAGFCLRHRWCSEIVRGLLLKFWSKADFGQAQA